MSHLGLAKAQMIYSNPSTGVQIFIGTISNGSVKVVIKEYAHPSMTDANLNIGEALAQARLQHPNICKLYECYLDRNQGGDYLCVLILELLEIDLHSEINHRKHIDSPYSDAEIIEFLRQMTSALTYMQENGVSHRDIKPQNIFLSGGTFKLGDFGSASRFDAIDPKAGSLAGSPFFLSPELKRVLLSGRRGEQACADIDPFKSDVYSLGVTVLFLALLGAPTRLMNLDRLREATEEVLLEVGVSGSLKDIVRRMLAIEPANRIDFRELSRLIESQSPSQALHNPYSSSFPDSETLFAPTCCIQCNKIIQNSQWTDDIPIHLRIHEDYFPTLCSLQCLTGFNLLATTERPLKCIGCEGMLSMQPVRLTCGHLFHDEDCLVYNVFVQFKGDMKETEFNCPACHCITDVNYIRSLIGEVFFQKFEKLGLQMCANCRVKLPIYKYRGCKKHRFCHSCLGVKPGIFSTCPKCRSGS